MVDSIFRTEIITVRCPSWDTSSLKISSNKIKTFGIIFSGGIYTYRCPKDKTNTVWQELCLAAIGEQFSVIDDDDIVGISVQSRDTPPDIIQIWNSNPSEQAQKAIDEKILQLFPDFIFPVKFYKANSSHVNFEAKNN